MTFGVIYPVVQKISNGPKLLQKDEPLRCNKHGPEVGPMVLTFKEHFAWATPNNVEGTKEEPDNPELEGNC